jgi:hypothetical protein
MLSEPSDASSASPGCADPGVKPCETATRGWASSRSGTAGSLGASEDSAERFAEPSAESPPWRSADGCRLHPWE